MLATAQPGYLWLAIQLAGLMVNETDRAVEWAARAPRPGNFARGRGPLEIATMIDWLLEILTSLAGKTDEPEAQVGPEIIYIG